MLLKAAMLLGAAALGFAGFNSVPKHNVKPCHGHNCPPTTTSITSTTSTTPTTTTQPTTTATTPTTTTSPTTTTTPPPPPTYQFDDEFNGAAGTQPTQWSIFGGTSPPRWGVECFVNDPQHISVDGNGNLVLTATYNPGGVPCTNGSGPYESGGMDTNFSGLFNYKYGTAEARIKVPCGSGATGPWPAWWEDGPSWPTGGEIDTLEIMKDAPMHAQQTLHGPTTSGGSYQLNYIGALMDCNTFHTYGNIWTSGQVKFTVDGVVVKTYTPANVPSGGIWPFDSYNERLFLDLQIGASGGTPDPTTFPLSMVIDWVRIS